LNNFLKKYSFMRMLKFKSKRERYFVLAALGCVIIFLGVRLVVRPFLVSQNNLREEIPVKIKQLAKYRQVIASKPQIARSLKLVQKFSKINYQKLLSGDTPPVAAANLQDILKTLAVKNNISLKSEKVLDTRALNFFTQIPVQIEFITTITSFTDFLYDIENHEKALIVPSLNISAAGYRDPKDIRVSIVVAGLMRETKNNH